jgi:hypothetical protein
MCAVGHGAGFCEVQLLSGLAGSSGDTDCPGRIVPSGEGKTKSPLIRDLSASWRAIAKEIRCWHRNGPQSRPAAFQNPLRAVLELHLGAFSCTGNPCSSILQVSTATTKQKPPGSRRPLPLRGEARQQRDALARSPVARIFTRRFTYLD